MGIGPILHPDIDMLDRVVRIIIEITILMMILVWLGRILQLIIIICLRAMSKQ